METPLSIARAFQLSTYFRSFCFPVSVWRHFPSAKRNSCVKVIILVSAFLFALWILANGHVVASPTSVPQNHVPQIPVLPVSLLSQSHPEHQFHSNNSDVIVSLWFHYCPKSCETDQLVLSRVGLTPRIITSFEALDHHINGHFYIITHKVVVARPHYRRLIQKALDLAVDSPVKIPLDKQSWVIVSKTRPSLEHSAFVTMNLSSTEQMSGKLIPPFTVFIPSSRAWNLKFQAQSDADAGFPPLHVVSEEHFKDLSPKYEVEDTAFVYTFTTPEGTNDCDVINWEPENLAGMRIILFVQDSCSDHFSKLISLSKIPRVEVATYSHEVKFAPLEIFGPLKYRASFYVKSLYLQRLNNYLEKPVKRIISVDWDYYLLKSIDHLFDLPLSEETLLATPGSSHGSILNGGLLVFSPGYGEEFIEFWQEMLENYDGWHYTVKSAKKLTGSEQETFAYWYIRHGNYHMLPPYYNSLIKSYGKLMTSEEVPMFLDRLTAVHAGSYKPHVCVLNVEKECEAFYLQMKASYFDLLCSFEK
ncbi:hypothetical protein GEMRC1_011256 [Eukaryota sp. GEM-RC1]